MLALAQIPARILQPSTRDLTQAQLYLSDRQDLVQARAAAQSDRADQIDE